MQDISLIYSTYKSKFISAKISSSHHTRRTDGGGSIQTGEIGWAGGRRRGPYYGCMQRRPSLSSLLSQHSLSLPPHTQKKIHLMSALFWEGNRARTREKVKKEIHTATLQMRRNVDIVEFAKKKSRKKKFPHWYSIWNVWETSSSSFQTC